MLMNTESRLLELGLELPEAPTPAGSYVPVRVWGHIVFVSGHTASSKDQRKYLGKVGKEVSLEEAALSARDACLNCLASLKNELGSLDMVDRAIKVVGYVNSAPGFDQQPQVVNGASDLLVELWGEQGRHARSAIGVAELPSGASVELELIVGIKDRI
jgi:enamine deaminase RidA (YjgF/YER057c/UK114 family)